MALIGLSPGLPSTNTFSLLDIWKELTRMLFNYRCSREKQPYAAHRAEVNPPIVTKQPKGIPQEVPI